MSCGLLQGLLIAICSVALELDLLVCSDDFSGHLTGLHHRMLLVCALLLLESPILGQIKNSLRILGLEELRGSLHLLLLWLLLLALHQLSTAAH